MPRVIKLRISRMCEAGRRQDERGAWIDYHQQCSGYEDRKVGRPYRCKCACHIGKPAPRRRD